MSRILGQQFSIKLLSVIVDPVWRSWINQKGFEQFRVKIWAALIQQEPPIEDLVSYCSWKFFWNYCVNVLFYLGKWLSCRATLYILYLFSLTDLQNLFTFHLQQWFFFVTEAQTSPGNWKNQSMALSSPVWSRRKAGLKAHVLEVQGTLTGVALQAPISSSSLSSARPGVENLCMLVK